MGLKRIFIGIQLEDLISAQILQLISDLRERAEHRGLKIRWVDKANLHITLKFIGDVEEERMSGIENLVCDVASSFSTVEFELSGIGAFPNASSPSSLWLGVRDETKTLFQIADSLEESLKLVGISGETRKFRPHITIGRSQDNKSLKEILERDCPYKIGVSPARAITIFESKLSSEGSRYYPVKTMLFKA